MKEHMEEQAQAMLEISDLLEKRDFTSIKEIVKHFAATRQFDLLTPIFLDTLTNAICKVDNELLAEVLEMLKFENIRDLSACFINNLVSSEVLTEDLQYKH